MLFYDEMFCVVNIISSTALHHTTPHHTTLNHHITLRNTPQLSKIIYYINHKTRKEHKIQNVLLMEVTWIDQQSRIDDLMTSLMMT